ncbi:TIGR01841 family phasin [Paraburkholderia sp. CNPSo 3274]|uniref:TIGR01841 family phasin n=1 Tax=Paraburkholderia sp. CNPSo 3274 TaxID=2940932 RepID=UPI0020B8A3EB|nr:TIGR01841 family phasin [Paraburkholderia sp. CNPSo 3274]MCP3711904.1 TIGR01841 family phasin [Paraburkholderia sp. CNPSo 3274]
MSTLTTEQLVAAQKSGVETSFVFLNKAFEGIEKLADLNVQTVKSTLAENQEFAVKALSAKEPQETFSQQSILVQPAVERVQSYWHHVYEILSSTQAEFAVLAEAQCKQFQSDAHSFIDGLTKNAPAGSESVVAAWKTFITTASDTANSAYETAAKAARQAVETAESNLNAASTAKRTRQAVAPVESDAKQ